MRCPRHRENSNQEIMTPEFVTTETPLDPARVQIFPTEDRIAELDAQRIAAAAAHASAIAASEAAEKQVDRLQEAWRRLNVQLTALNTDYGVLRAEAIDRAVTAFVEGNAKQIAVPDQMINARATRNTVTDLTAILKAIVEVRIPLANEENLRLRWEQLRAHAAAVTSIFNLEAAITMNSMAMAVAREGQLEIKLDQGRTGAIQREAREIEKRAHEAEAEYRLFVAERQKRKG
jgi:hypothetical protein